MESNGSSGNVATLLLALLGGAAIGAGIALLYAPQSGRRTRQKLKEFGEDAEEYARELAAKAEEALERAGRKGQEFVDDKKRQLAGALDGSKHAN